MTLLVSGTASAQPSIYEQSSSTQVLGSTLGGVFSTGVPDGIPAVQTTANVDILGKTLQALQGSISIPNAPSGSSTLEFYSFGKRVFSESFYATNDGILGGDVGLAPTEVRVPLVTYPVGPLLLEIDAGVRFQADLQGHLLPTIVIPSPNSNITAEMQASATAAGFIEGYASLFVVRAGVGGLVDVLNAQADANAVFFFDGGSPTASISAFVQFLAGEFYAFLDAFDIFEWSWANLWTDDLFSWNGVCYSTGGLSCPQN